ncbi:lmo0937 family membrane protein [Cellulophaga omnivescoria]|nr:lmo0937 family membrane protein [Cellulophaga omnivescoria]WBU88663.1 lmo0937 family membrane protein [Cellulophaga omnivescoria]WKB80638.1 lmo0937 family membrane protein [Cellulophaga lytica]
MKKLLLPLAIILIIIWALAFFIYALGYIAHIFLVAATILFIIKVLQEK